MNRLIKVVATAILALGVGGAFGQAVKTDIPNPPTPTAKVDKSSKLKEAENRLATLQNSGTQLQAEQKSLDQESEIYFKALRDITEFRNYLAVQQKITELNKRISAFNNQLTGTQKEIDELKKP